MEKIEENVYKSVDKVDKFVESPVNRLYNVYKSVRNVEKVWKKCGKANCILRVFHRENENEQIK